MELSRRVGGLAGAFIDSLVSRGGSQAHRRNGRFLGRIPDFDRRRRGSTISLRRAGLRLRISRRGFRVAQGFRGNGSGARTALADAVGPFAVLGERAVADAVGE